MIKPNPKNIEDSIAIQENNKAFKKWSDKIPENEDGTAYTPTRDEEIEEAFQETPQKIKKDLDEDYKKAAQILQERKDKINIENVRQDITNTNKKIEETGKPLKQLAEESAKIFKEQVIPAMGKTNPSSEGSPWNQISIMFVCASCQTKSANGYEKYGTKICENCHSDIEATNMAMKYDQARDLEREEQFGDIEDI
jgi:hypothetical protein